MGLLAPCPTPAFLQVGDHSRDLLYALPQVFQLVAVEHSRAGHHHGSHMAMALVMMVNHPSIIWVCDCLTLVINHEMITPYYQPL